MSRKLNLKELKIKYIKTFIEEATENDIDKIFKACAGVDHIPYTITFTDNPTNIIDNYNKTICSGNGECKDV